MQTTGHTDLLGDALVIERDDLHHLRVIEVGNWGVLQAWQSTACECRTPCLSMARAAKSHVERDVAVLADPDAREVDVCISQPSSIRLQRLFA